MKREEERLLAQRDNALEALRWDLYRQMATIRRTEETLLSLFSRGLLFGTVHTCLGQEACAVGVINALDRSRDVIWSNHRGHGHFLAYCDDVAGLVAEVMGRMTGVCGGIGGSQHLHRDGFYTNGILGGTLPCAVGTAFAEKAKRSGAVAAVFFGDGASAEGTFHESMNMAALWDLPVLFVLEDNGIAQSTPSRLQHAGELARHGEPFGIETLAVDVSTVAAVHGAASHAVQVVRRESRPFFLVLRTFRMGPHSKGDDLRPVDEIAAYRRRDPLNLLRSELLKADAQRLEELETQIDRRLERAVAEAIEAPFMTAQQFSEEKCQW